MRTTVGSGQKTTGAWISRHGVNARAELQNATQTRKCAGERSKKCFLSTPACRVHWVAPDRTRKRNQSVLQSPLVPSVHLIHYNLALQPKRKLRCPTYTFFRLGIHWNMSAAHTFRFPDETTRTDQSHDGWCTLQSSWRAHCSFLGHRHDWPSWDVGLHRWSGIARDTIHQSPSTLSHTSVCSVVHCSWRDAPVSILRKAFCGYTLSRSRVHDRAVFSRQIRSRDGLLCCHRLTFGFDVPNPRWLDNCL